MPTQLTFDHYFNLFSVLCAAGSIGWLGWKLWKRKQRGLFAQPPSEIQFEEKAASGRSMKNWYTRLGRANNCLRIVVTNTELWITPIFPFSAFAETLDLDHRIDLTALRSVRRQSRFPRTCLSVSFLGMDQQEHTLEITPRRMEQLVDTLRAQGVAVDAIEPAVGANASASATRGQQGGNG